MKRLLLALALLAAPVFAASAPSAPSATPWAGFRGDGTSHTQARGLPLTWSADQNVAWNVELPGYGQSSPVVWGDRVFVTSIAGPLQDRLLVRSLELATGKMQWEHEYKGSQGVATSDYVSKAAPTPVVDGERLYLFYETGDLLALDHKGETRWQRSLVKEYGALKSNHGLGSSPILVGNALILFVTFENGAYLLAVDRQSGKTLWKRDHSLKICWSTPVVTEQDGKILLVLNANDRVAAFDAASGEQIWMVTGLKGNTVASPSIGNGLVVGASSERGSTVAVRLGGAGDVTASHVAWRAETATSSFASPLIQDGCVYIVNRTGVVYCLDLATGKAHWDRRMGASPWASPLAADGRIYFFGTDGSSLVVKPGAQLEVLAENRFPVEGKVYGVAAVDGAFLLRIGNRLVRVGK
jgi:outer membrane protein assembly factor BamB